MQAGIGFLKENGLLKAAAQKEIDYSTIADPASGPIFASLPEGSYFSLGHVVKLHHQAPELFALVPITITADAPGADQAAGASADRAC